MIIITVTIMMLTVHSRTSAEIALPKATKSLMLEFCCTHPGSTRMLFPRGGTLHPAVLLSVRKTSGNRQRRTEGGSVPNTEGTEIRLQSLTLCCYDAVSILCVCVCVCVSISLSRSLPPLNVPSYFSKGRFSRLHYLSSFFS